MILGIAGWSGSGKTFLIKNLIPILNKKGIKVISNDFLYCNYIILKAFLFTKKINFRDLKNKISYLNSLKPKKNNYFSKNFGKK